MEVLNDKCVFTVLIHVLYFANDGVGYLDRIIGGIPITEEELALDVIHEVGPEGNFLGEEHTLENYGKNWRPGTLSRENWTAFENSGKKDYGDRANQAVRDILAKGVKHPLLEKVQKRLEEIMEEAREKLAESREK